MLNKCLQAFTVASGLLAAGSCAIDEGGDESDLEQAVLGAPGNVSVSPTAQDRATVSWSPVTGAIKYYVYQSTGMSGPYVLVGSERAPSTSALVAHLSANTAYCFEVRSEDGTGPGAFSAPGCSTTPNAPPPPNSVLSSQTTPTSVTVTWAPVANVTKYYLYQSTTVNGTYSYVGTTLAPSTSDVETNLAAGTYCYKVKDEGPTGISAFSVADCTTSLKPPTNVTATRVTATRARIDWTKATGATKYYVYESKAGAAFTLRGSVLDSASPTLNVAGLVTGTQYCYQLKSQGTPVSNVSNYSLPPACVTP